MSAIPALTSLPICALLLLAGLPNRWAAVHTLRLRNWVTCLAAANAIAAIGAFFGSIAIDVSYFRLLEFGRESPFAISLYLDGTSTLMWSLVSFVGWVNCRFSVRYLDGEAYQGRFLCWTGFTIGAISLAVISGNLVLMILALLLTSIGLHQLLVHYDERPAAHRAAALKFIFSRLGDLSLLVASFLLYRDFGTLELPALLTAAADLADSPERMAQFPGLSIVGWLLVLCAAFKSAQFPFHTWLPETMEAPTPVSALMHAGIVNAGGYLLIRLAPIVTLAPSAMWALAATGAFTACIAALSMLSQTSVKRSLAYSTIAQMGFMMFQCGLGAFSAAMLHIVVHSLYKAHAFLSSGSVMSERFAMISAAQSPVRPSTRLATFLASTAISLGLFLSLASVFGVSTHSKPGGYLLGFILCLGIAHWLWRMLQNGRPFLLPGVGLSAVLFTVYFGSFTLVDRIISTGGNTLSSGGPGSNLLLAVAVAFTALFVVETALARSRKSRWLQSLYVHSSNGFYMDAVWRQIARSFTV